MRIGLPMSLLCMSLLAIGVATTAQESSAANDAAAAKTSLERTPIRSQAMLDAYLHEQSGKPTPFDALPPGARERFFLSLHWGRSGLGGFDPTPLADELPQAQIDAIRKLFGDAVAAYAPRSRRSDPLSVGTPAVATHGISNLERVYNDFYRAQRQRDIDEKVLSAQLIERFDTQLAGAYLPESLRMLDDRHLDMLWHAAHATATLSHAPRPFPERAGTDDL